MNVRDFYDLKEAIDLLCKNINGQAIDIKEHLIAAKATLDTTSSDTPNCEIDQRLSEVEQLIEWALDPVNEIIDLVNT